LRLGYIGRLIPLKGVALIPHVIKGLINNHVPVECLIAGEGSERASIEKIASSLGILHAIKFLGCIQNVSSFYETIDILLVPSIREPLGLVAQEAALAGCPVVASCVDGLPEVVIDKITGFCPPPTLPLKSLASFGGTHAQLPDLVFDPINDCLMEPKIVDPNALVSSLLEIISSNERFYVMSKHAILQAKKRPTISHYAQALLDALM
jgi:glycosyltransferase involved in cell wall biosynthesis